MSAPEQIPLFDDLQTVDVLAHDNESGPFADAGFYVVEEDFPEALEPEEMWPDDNDNTYDYDMRDYNWENKEKLRRRDPLAPNNLSLYHPEHDNNLYQTCLPVGLKSKFRKMWFLVSASQFTSLQALGAWSPRVDQFGYRYGYRREVPCEEIGMSSESALHREVVRQRLVKDEEYREAKIKEFNLGRIHNLPLAAQIAVLMSNRQVHHRNHITEDCRLENLDLVDQVANMRQRETAGASGIKNVPKRKDGRFEARLRMSLKNGRSKTWSLGLYEQPAHAAMARCLACFADPKWLRVLDYTPSASEAEIWIGARQLVETGFCSSLGLIEGKLPGRMNEVMALVRKVEKKVKTHEAKISLRDDGSSSSLDMA